MKSTFKFVLVFVIIAVDIILFFIFKDQIFVQPKGDTYSATHTLTTRIMKLQSTAFQNNGNIPELYTCDDKNITPPLQISGVPTRAKDLALIVDDPDAPNGDWVHWLVWNINPTTTQIAENSVPAGAIQGTTSFGKSEWGGPCPPSGTHHYQFKIYALDTTLNLTSKATKAELEAAMKGHIMDQAMLVALYQRK